MAMPTATLYGQVTGWLSVLSLALLLYRSVAGRTLKLYPVFYGYVALVLLTTAIGLSVRWADAGAYRLYYWVVQSALLLMGVGVTWEIYRKILARFPGVRRLACMLLSVI